MSNPSEGELERIRSILEKAQTWLDARRFDAAIDGATKAIASIEQAMGLSRRPDGSYVTAPGAPKQFDVAFADEQARAHGIRGMAYRHAGQLQVSAQDLMLAAKIRKSLSADDELPSEDLAVTLHNLGNTMVQIATPKAFEMATAVFAEAIAIREKLMATPGHGHVANFLAGTLKAQASVEMLRARNGMPAELERAAADLRRALEIRKRLVEVEGRQEFAGTLAITRYSLADVLGMTLRFVEAVSLLDQAVAQMKSLVGKGQKQLRDDLALCLSARVLYGIGAAETVAGQGWPSAAAIECAALYGALVGEGRLDQLAAFGEFVSQRALPCLFKSGDVPKAAQVLEAALRVMIDRFGDEQPAVVAQLGALMCAVPPPVKDALVRSSPGLAAQLARLARTG